MQASALNIDFDRRHLFHPNRGAAPAPDSTVVYAHLRSNVAKYQDRFPALVYWFKLAVVPYDLA
jgi:hypothetical protein